MSNKRHFFVSMVLLPALLTFSCVSNNCKISSISKLNVESMKNPKGAVELLQGVYNSHMLRKALPFRVLSPINPKWPLDHIKQFTDGEGLPLVVYVMNLTGIPRPGSVSDLQIIDELIERKFLVVTVDFQFGKYTDHLSFQKDINGLFCSFGGRWHSEQPYFTANRKELLNFPGPNENLSFTSFSYPDKPQLNIPIDKRSIYVVPSGYTVKTRQVFKKFDTSDKDSWLYMDIVYPRSSEKGVPILLEASSGLKGKVLVNANTPILYSWLFNGYAFATMSHRPEHNDYMTHGICYLQSQKEQFSLNGIIATAGISKSCSYAHRNSYQLEEYKSKVEKELYGTENKEVKVVMPAVGRLDINTCRSLQSGSPAIVLSWCSLDKLSKKFGKQPYETIQNSYLKAGISEKCLFLESAAAGHEYDVYHLNQIMSFFDKFCK